MTFKHEAMSDICAMCQVIVTKYLKKKHGSFWIDYAEENDWRFSDDTFGWTYETFVMCDQCGDSKDHILVRIHEEDDSLWWAVFESIDAGFEITWEDIGHAD